MNNLRAHAMPQRLTAVVPRCPYCRQPMPAARKTLAGNPCFPFCSDRCKMADLSRWMRGEYAIEQPLATLTEEQRQDLPTGAPVE